MKKPGGYGDSVVMANLRGQSPDIRERLGCPRRLAGEDRVELRKQECRALDHYILLIDFVLDCLCKRLTFLWIGMLPNLSFGFLSPLSTGILHRPNVIYGRQGIHVKFG